MPAPSTFERAVGVRLHREAIRAIELSGEKPSEWLREAARMRIERERQTPEVNPVEKQLATLRQSVADVQRDLAKLHRASVDHRASLDELQKTQSALHHQLIKTHEEFSEGLTELADSLLNAFAEQAETLLKARSESLLDRLPPPPPRRAL